MPAPPKPKTVADLAAIADHDRLEIIGGSIVEKAVPSPDHAFTKARLGGLLHGFNRRPGRRGPGGWWILPEIHVEYRTGEVYCHDVAGWRRERVPEFPTTWPTKLRPDWVCEIVSPKHERNDLVVKPRTLHGVEVPHYWAVHPEEKMLLVHRWDTAGYTVVLTATSGDRVRAEPFEAIELDVAELFGDETDE
ncbi:MAG: Uma2 family endonuclease [Deltaproteobacteria bacterium]|nr:Uma2 family endonuclease [Deltaproteobacteria bacterium]